MKRKSRIYLTNAFLILLCIFSLNEVAIANGIELSDDSTSSDGATLEKNLAKADAESLYQSGLAYYKNEKYDEAIKQLETAVTLEPEVSKYHHILAVSYGREAENVNWFKAMDYAKRTLAHLKKSDELDPNNLEILDDLMDYYHEAPRFLGGNTEKGDKIAALIEELSHKNQ